MATQYQPNFNDPRVRARIKQAYGFSKSAMNNTTEHHWATRIIDKHFGQQQTPISKYLRSILLTCTDNRYSMDNGVTKAYTTNNTGMRYIRDMLMNNTSMSYAEYLDVAEHSENVAVDVAEHSLSDKEDIKDNNSNLYPSVYDLFDMQVVSEWCKREYGEELATLTFNYDDKSGRLWHPIQSIRREYKKHILAEAGLKYQYDIECCAPTLILQHAQKCGMDEYLFAINQYLKNKTELRQQLAELADIPETTAKIIINALFCGARLGNNPEFALSRLLGNDQSRIMALQQSDFINQLKADIKQCWTAIEPTMTLIYKTNADTGKMRKVPLSSKHKWNRYFDLERSVLDSVIKYMSITDNKMFAEHDGWTSMSEIDVDALTDYVREHTGYAIRLSVSVNQ